MRGFYLNLTENGPDGLLAWGLYLVLLPVGFLYGTIQRIRAFMYAIGVLVSYRSTAHVVSVGNLTVGGTGKTPMADFLVKYFSTRKIVCAIVSRGYGGSYLQDVGVVRAAGGRIEMTASECGDEPYLLADRNPDVSVYVARKRALGVRTAERAGARVIILDDGFQHLAVQRDVNILLLDASRPFGNGQVLPAGNLRESVSAMQRADLLVMTRADRSIKSHPVAKVPVILSRHKPSANFRKLDGSIVARESLKGKSCLAFAGIARPDQFFESLHEVGFSQLTELPFDDHQVYDRATLEQIYRLCESVDVLVTTEKDGVKLSGTDLPKPCLLLGVDLLFEESNILTEFLDNTIAEIRGVTGD